MNAAQSCQLDYAVVSPVLVRLRILTMILCNEMDHNQSRERVATKWSFTEGS